MAIERHRDHGVVADERGELDRADGVPARQHALVIPFAHGLSSIELLGVIEDGEPVGVEPARPASGVNILDHRLRQAGLAGHLLVDVPFELRVAMPAGDEDRELLEMRRQRRAEAQELAELLPFVGELGAMQHRPQRPAQLPARAGDDGVVDAALLRRHLVGWKERNARQRMSPFGM